MQEPFNIRCSSDREIPKQYKQIGPRHGWGNEYLRVVKLTRDKPFTGAAQMRKCMALSGPVRENVSCTIYEQRPHACINYAPGSPSCVLARKWASLEDPEDLYHLGRS
jgi:Fe-S-cluster containining protein